ELGTARGDLDDAVALRLGEAAQCRVQGLGRGDVDGRVGELLRLRPVEHLVVDLGGCDGHLSAPYACGMAYCVRSALTWNLGCDVIVGPIFPDLSGWSTVQVKSLCRAMSGTCGPVP